MEQNNFENILNECMDRVLAGETVEQVLAAYPEYTAELEPLLRTVASAAVIEDIKPRPEFRSVAAAEFQAAARDLQDKKQNRGFFSRWYHSWKFGWSIASVSVLIVFMAVTGTVLAASDSMPDEALYSVKLATEQIHIAVTPNEITKAELNAEYAERRIDELVYMAEKEDSDGVLLVASNLNSNLKSINTIIDEEVVSNTSNEADALMSSQATSGESSEEPVFGIAKAPEDTDDVRKSAVVPSSALPETAAAGTTSASTPEIEPAPDETAGENRLSVPGGSFDTATIESDVVIPERYAELEELIQQYIEHQARLEVILRDASPEMRPAIRLAIAQSIAEYEEALRNLELLARIIQ